MFEMSLLAGRAFPVRPNALAAFRAPEIRRALSFTYLKRSLNI
jgi:hypothetical protein